ncbi:MAG: 23S rRNA (uracil(1939)-C(5))-methyltransferase RlmD [Verrucomicrobia bacterium]|nr:23S rRNA (uracil(1939)-C(5))-methyltransferase RlmD [Verrucomicrobiota bacterium]
MSAPQSQYRRGDRLVVTIVDVAEKNRCVAKTDEGAVLFVEGMVAIGDVVDVEVRKRKRSYYEATVVEVVTPAATRTQPACAHFGICGGCKWQHVGYPEQLRLKQKLVTDALERIGHFPQPPVEPVLPSERVYGYRNKVDLDFSNERFLLAEELNLTDAELPKPRDFALGFHRSGFFRKVIDIDQCHIASEVMNEALDCTRGFFQNRGTSVYSTVDHTGFLRNLVLRTAEATQQFMVYLVTSSRDEALMGSYREALLDSLGDRLTTLVNGVTERKNQVAYAENLHIDHGPGIITEHLGDLAFDIAPNAFFQTNSRQALRLYQTVKNLAALAPEEQVLDLYCGTGTIGLFIADACAGVTGFDVESSAIANARVNAERNQRPHAQFYVEDLREIGPALLKHGIPRKPGVVITDPPRAGMHEDTTRSLADLKPDRIVYVSCNPASLARDAALLRDLAGYQLQTVIPVDLFPHTYHVESVALLQR